MWVMDEGLAPPAVGVNENFGETYKEKTRPDEGEITKETRVTAPPIAPDATEIEASGSVLD